jgi:hypothetical protein
VAVPEEVRQRYAWMTVQLQATNSIIEPVLTVFRFRQIKPEYLPLYEEGAADLIRSRRDEEDLGVT